jgi:hypothetical protein
MEALRREIKVVGNASLVHGLMGDLGAGGDETRHPP